MLLELITYLTTPCPPYIRRMGYLYEALGLKCRYKRQPESWRPHLENTRRFALSAARKSRNRNKAVILGSGLLLDVPIEELSSTFREVVLIDVVCLPEVRRRIRAYDNVRFVRQDVANIAETLFQNVQSGRHELPFADPVLPEIDKDAGLVISLNILSQLTVIPRRYVLQKLPGIARHHVESWCRRIVEAHYSFLLSLPCSVCLISDYRYAHRAPAGAITAQGTTLSGVLLPEPDDSWVWHIAPLGEESRLFSKELNVGAWLVRQG